MSKKKERRTPPYYVVLGMPRGGTSMMMQSLIAGGMVAKYSNSSAGIDRDRKEGFLSNPVDVYEWVRMPLKWPFALRGRLIKLFLWQIFHIDAAPLEVVLITREEESLRASIDKYLEFGASRKGESPNPSVLHARDILDRDNIADVYRGMEMVLSEAPAVKGLTVVSYEQMCADPHKELAKLAQAGWPIDVAQAATTINPNWRQEVA